MLVQRLARVTYCVTVPDWAQVLHGEEALAMMIVMAELLDDCGLVVLASGAEVEKEELFAHTFYFTVEGSDAQVERAGRMLAHSVPTQKPG